MRYHDVCTNEIRQMKSHLNVPLKISKIVRRGCPRGRQYLEKRDERDTERMF